MKHASQKNTKQDDEDPDPKVKGGKEEDQGFLCSHFIKFTEHEGLYPIVLDEGVRVNHIIIRGSTVKTDSGEWFVVCT